MTPVEDIKSRLNLVEVVQGYVRLQKAGTNYKANCPFHSEQTASFFVSPSKQIWHCFGCGLGGDVFKFVMEIEGQGFPEVLRVLAERAGVELRREDPNVRTERNRLYAVSDAASQFFQSALHAAPAAQEYLRDRGLTPETVARFRIGFAPPAWDALTRALTTKGFRRDDVLRAGLAIHSAERNSQYDRFRGRIMFPIQDAAGRVIGFGGRLFVRDPARPDEAKYMNTPQTLIYDKSRVLYGFEQAKHDVRRKNAVVIVEGYMDCIMSHQAGVQHTVAVSGTALTPAQLGVLKRLCNTVVTSFDTDSAGDTATRRSLALAATHGFERKIAAIPSGKDPADTVKDDPAQWVRAVEEAKPVVQYFFRKAFSAHSPETAEGKKAIAALLFPYIVELNDEIERAHWVGEVARAYGIREEFVWNDLEKYRQPDVERDPAGVPGPATEPRRAPSRRDLLEERFLALLLHMGPNARAAAAGTSQISFASAVHGEVYDRVVGTAGDGDRLTGAAHELMQLLRFKGEVFAAGVPDLDAELLATQRELEKCCLRDALTRVSDEIHSRERANACTELVTLLQHFRELSLKLRQLS